MCLKIRLWLAVRIGSQSIVWSTSCLWMEGKIQKRIVNTLIIEAWRPLCSTLMSPSALQDRASVRKLGIWSQIQAAWAAVCTQPQRPNVSCACATEKLSPSVLQLNGAQLVATANIRRHTAAYVPCTWTQHLFISLQTQASMLQNYSLSFWKIKFLLLQSYWDEMKWNRGLGFRYSRAEMGFDWEIE